MKLLFDQNISYRIIKKIVPFFADSNQIRILGLENFSDQDIWKYAKQNKYSIVTFDADFSDIANIKGHPPKIIWLRTGNLTTANIAELLIKHRVILSEFIQNKEFRDISCLEIE